MRLCTLTQSHGLTDVSPQDTTLEKLRLKFERDGTFQHFNGAVAPLGRISYFEHSMPKWFSQSFDTAETLEGKSLDIKAILSRIPGLETNYERTFSAPANTTPFDIYFDHTVTGVELRIDDPEHFTDKASLIDRVAKWRTRWPFLHDWCFLHAEHAWGYAILIFTNVDKSGFDEFGADFSSTGTHGYNYRNDVGKLPRTEFLKIIPPLSGGLGGPAKYAIQPFGGKHLSELSWQFLGSFLLSTLVRYRPQVWQHAVSRSVSSERPADDRSLALLEQFTRSVLNDFPSAAIQSIDYMRHPG